MALYFSPSIAANSKGTTGVYWNKETGQLIEFTDEVSKGLPDNAVADNYRVYIGPPTGLVKLREVAATVVGYDVIEGQKFYNLTEEGVAFIKANPTLAYRFQTNGAVYNNSLRYTGTEPVRGAQAALLIEAKAHRRRAI